MKCAVCGGTTKKEIIKLELWVGDKLVVIEDVPSKVCGGCGEKYFSAKVSKQIDKLLESGIKAKKKLEVPVFSLKTVAAG